ncbi:hypothetical protein D3C87_1684480 [compost metagenome]
MVRAASALMALSKASGPPIRQPVIWPRSAILHRAAASSVAIIFGLTVSTAANTATLGKMSAPNRACQRSTAFCTMSTLVARSGAMFTAASVMMKALE